MSAPCTNCGGTGGGEKPDHHCLDCNGSGIARTPDGRFAPANKEAPDA